LKKGVFLVESNYRLKGQKSKNKRKRKSPVVDGRKDTNKGTPRKFQGRHNDGEAGKGVFGGDKNGVKTRVLVERRMR